jgi:signal transduction histidine kinase/integral membrane sensor domain MASE1/CheY-like chemotaxis protein
LSKITSLRLCPHFDRLSTPADSRTYASRAKDMMPNDAWSSVTVLGRKESNKAPQLRNVAGILVLAAIYFGAAKLGLSMAVWAEQVSAVWPPTGIALAAILIFGYRMWPGIALGALVANATANEPIPTACGIALGNTLEAVVGSWLLVRWVRFDNALERLKDVLGLIALAAGASTTISATIGVVSLCLGGVQAWSDFGSLWSVWWLGDAMGNLIVAPVLLSSAVSLHRWPLHRVVEASAIALGLVIIGLVVFNGRMLTDSGYYPLAYAVFPFVIWAALRFGQQGTTVVTFVASILAIWGALHGLGPFGTGTIHERLVSLQVFMGVVAVTGLILAAALAERRRDEQRKAALHAVTKTLAEAATLEEATPRIIQSVCDSLTWQIGAIWRVDQASAILRCAGVWHVGAVTFPAFEKGIGLPGRVWMSGESAWIPDVVHDPNFPRAAIARQEGLHAAFGFPIRLGSEIHGVIEFFSSQTRRPDEDLLRLMGTIGSQIGQFIARRRGEAEVRERTEQLLAADRRKNEFLATLAHELRNPLAAITAAFELMQLSAAGTPEFDDARQILRRQLSHMVRLIDDLLDISRIAHGKFELRIERIELGQVVSNAVEAHGPLLKVQGQTLVVQPMRPAIHLEADATRLAQVVSNLLDNASKYNLPGGRIWLSVEAVDGAAEIRVRDTGVGIPADMLPHVFEMFAQAEHGWDRTRGGIGIGLGLVRTIVEMHGGTVEAQSAGPGKGSEFIVRLPMAASSEDVQPPPGATELASLPRRNILVVEDDQDAGHVLAGLLEAFGQNVRLAQDGQSALEAVQSEKPELVISDISMPGMSGYELARRLRGMAELDQVRLVAITGYGRDEDQRRAKEAGFDDHLVKPVSVRALKELLSASIG